jgi:O-antigen/teichoic acid export membrane protein
MGIVIRQSIKATIVSYVGACIGALLVIYIYPKSLTPEQLGLTRILTEAALLFSSFAQLGTSSIAIKFFPYFKDSKNNHNGFQFIVLFLPLIGFIMFVGVFLLLKSEIISIFLEKSNLFTTYIILVIPLAFFWMYNTIYETYSSLLQRIVFPKLIKEILVRILTIAAILLFFFKLITLTQFVFIFVSIYGIATLLNIVYVNSLQKINLNPNFKFLKNPLRGEMIRFMSYVIIVGIGSSISSKIDVFMVSQKINLTGTGIFTISFFIASFIEIPSRVIFQITTPFASDALKNNDLKLVDSLYKRVAINQLLIAGSIFLLIWANADNIFMVMPNGHVYETGKFVILFVGLAKVFDAATGINASILGNSKYYYYTLFFIFILAFFTITNNLFFIPLYGIVGSAIATAISIFLYNAILVWFVWWKMKIHPFSKQTLKALLILTLVFFINIYFYKFSNPFVDGIVRSVCLLTIFIIAIIKLKISDDLNKTLFSLLKRGKKYFIKSIK